MPDSNNGDHADPGTLPIFPGRFASPVFGAENRSP